MNKAIRLLLGILLLSLLMPGCDGTAERDHADRNVTESRRQDPDDPISSLRILLRAGTAREKEEVLDLFMKDYPAELVPDVIEAILDDTVSPRHGDTGWGRVHHQAASAMGRFAQRIDGKRPGERDRDRYSFFNDGGVGTESRRAEVHRNWLEWWKESGKKNDDG